MQNLGKLTGFTIVAQSDSRRRFSCTRGIGATSNETSRREKLAMLNKWLDKKVRGGMDFGVEK